jgi:hypothetical protein
LDSKRKINIYYAGLDNYSLPLGDGEKLISVSSAKQVDYIKLLCLVADHVVVPPSFYFYWIGGGKTKLRIPQLMDLYQAGYVSSAVHSTMSDSTEFLEHKLAYGTTEDKRYIKENKKVLDDLFSEIPLTKRDVTVQSGGFREKVEGDIIRAYRDSKYKELLLSILSNHPMRGGVIASREEVNFLHYSAYNKGMLNKQELRKYYYTTNKCYYHQGAITYDSVISILDAHRYSVLGKYLFETKHGIQLGYDPQIIQGIFNSFGIGNNLISALSVEDVRKIRDSSVFEPFKTSYHDFTIELQKVELMLNGLSKEKLLRAQVVFREKFMSKYFDQSKNYDKKMSYWAFSEMTIFALALGVVGFFVIPVIGALLGFLPIVLWKTGLSLRFGEYVVDQLTETRTAFYQFISELKQLVAKLDRSESIQ